MRMSIVIPYMHNKWRYRLLTASLKTMPENDTEICIVELGKEQGLQPGLIRHGANVKYIFVKNEAPFNRAWAMNIGVRHLSEGQILILSDGDLVFQRGVADLWRQTQAPAVAWSRLHRLDKKTTEQYLEAGIFLKPCMEYASSVFSPPSTHSACGGVNVIPRDIFYETGGMIEVFEGWGGEDNATWAKLMAYGYSFTFLESDICHLWHRPRAQYGLERAYVFWMARWSREDWINNIDIRRWGELQGPWKEIKEQAYLKSYDQEDNAMSGRQLLAGISNDLGLDYINRGMYNEAINELRQCLCIEPNLASAHLNLATAYTKKGKLDNALSEYEKALTIDPDYGKAHYDLAILYVKMKEYRRAISHCDKALNLGLDIHPQLLSWLNPHRDQGRTSPDD